MNNNFDLKHFFHPYAIGIYIALSILALGGCKTTKKKSDISPVTKFYHSTTSLYNGYFNANVLLEEVVFDLTHDHPDNFSELLPIEKHLGSPHYKSAFPKLDTAIKKVSVVAAVHRVGEWTDDCYLLAGKAQYIKQDFDEAERTLKYLVKEFDPSNPSSQYWEYKKKPSAKVKKPKKGKKKQKPSTANLKNKYAEEAKGTGGISRDPAYNEGRLWLARTLLEKDLPGQAQGLINDVKGNYRRTKELDNLYHITQTEVYIYQKDYLKAATILTSAMDFAPNRDAKARYAFIAAQLYEISGDHTRASIYYDHARKFANSYEMIFNSELNQLKSAYANGNRSRSSVLASLENMTKDGKNDEYYDYIYFTMAQIYESSGELEDAVEFYTKALAHKTRNSTVTLDSYQALAKLYFNRDAFIKADKYLDSTLMSMNANHNDRADVQKLSDKIKPIADNLEFIALKDSLIMVSNMSPEEQKAIAAKIKAQKDKGSAGVALGGPGQLGGFKGSVAPPQGPRRGKYKGSFFAYQEDNKERRAQNFRRTWGDIPLVDNWRVSSLRDKGVFADSEDEDDSRNIDPADLLTEAEIERYLKDVPKSEKEIYQLELEIMEAMEKLGFQYRSTIDRPDLTVDILEQLLTRFTDKKINIDVYYNLYLAYQTLGNHSKAKEYKDLILQKFPNSAIAKNINNPTLESKGDSLSLKLAAFYQNTYNDFKKGNYENVHSRVQVSKTNFGEKNKYAAKFALLDAMATGKTHSEAEYAEALRKIISEYKGSAEATHAREILRFLDGSQTAFDDDAALSNFQIDDDKVHYIMVYIKNPKEVNRNQAKITVSDFNEKYFGLDKLKVSTIFLDIKDNNNPIIIVRQFKDRKKAMRYYETAKQFQDRFMPDGADYTILATNQQNYREILKSRTVVDYTDFFEAHYLRGK